MVRSANSLGPSAGQGGRLIVSRNTWEWMPMVTLGGGGRVAVTLVLSGTPACHFKAVLPSFTNSRAKWYVSRMPNYALILTSPQKNLL